MNVDHFPDAYSLGKAEDLLCRFLDDGGDPLDLPVSPPLTLPKEPKPKRRAKAATRDSAPKKKP